MWALSGVVRIISHQYYQDLPDHNIMPVSGPHMCFALLAYELRLLDLQSDVCVGSDAAVHKALQRVLACTFARRCRQRRWLRPCYPSQCSRLCLVLG